MDKLVKADASAKYIENEFINYTSHLIQKGYQSLLKEKKFNTLTDISYVIDMYRNLEQIYTGIDFAPDLSVNFRMNKVLNQLNEQEDPLEVQATMKEFEYEMSKPSEQRNLSYTNRVYADDLLKMKRKIAETKQALIDHYKRTAAASPDRSIHPSLSNDRSRSINQSGSNNQTASNNRSNNRSANNANIAGHPSENSPNTSVIFEPSNQFAHNIAMSSTPARGDEDGTLDRRLLGLEDITNLSF
ncbi:unnamed protein product [Diamesa serratosioi]